MGQPVAGWLGLMDRVEAFFDNDPQPTAEVVTGAFWLASHGGQQPAADYLLDRGAELNWIGYDKLTPRVGLASVRGTT
ncbi:hypothetical protein ABZ807_33215 [Micromonospora sp. NPDC047548]|uniref:hypothetical protein n=1 Tax=Micromonospora sp. NPDC047548 TaxID=3155624 RepID=UPI003401FC10